MSVASAVSSQRLPEETVPVIPPVPAEVFERRSARLHVFASNHGIVDYIKAMACLAEAQLAALRVLPSRDEKVKPPSSLNACYHRYGETWQKALRTIISEMDRVPLPIQSQAALSRLKSAVPAGLEFMAQSIVCGTRNSIDLAAAPFLAAALQVYWTDLASGVKPDAAERFANICPVCGSPPVAGVVLSGRKLRYLCCSLCATQWYVPRLICTKCGSTAGLSYFTIDGSEDGTKAEACGQCRTYLKLFYLESNPEADAFADDLGTMALDVLMSERAYGRNGLNLFLL